MESASFVCADRQKFSPVFLFVFVCISPDSFPIAHQATNPCLFKAKQNILPLDVSTKRLRKKENSETWSLLFETVWSDLEKFRQLGKILKVLVIFWVFMLCLAKKITYFSIKKLQLGRFSFLQMFKYLTNNLPMWSHFMKVSCNTPFGFVHSIKSFIKGDVFNGMSLNAQKFIYANTYLRTIEVYF